MKKKIILGLITIQPILAFAADDLEGVFDIVGKLITYAQYILIGLATLLFFYGLVKYILDTSKGGDGKDDKKIMTWGVVALFLMASVWGIVKIITGTFIDEGNNRADVPVYDIQLGE